MFTSIGMGCALYYCAQALTLGTHKLALVHAVSFVIILGAKLLSRQSQGQRWATITLLVGLNNFIVVSSVFDGLTKAHGLWFIAALPMATIFLWNQKATLVVCAITLLEIPLLAWIEHRFEIQREIESSSGTMFVMMLLMIFVFSLFSYLYTSRAHQKICTLESEARLLEQANRESLQAFEDKKIFLAKMSHELRTPMNGLLGCIRELHETNDVSSRALTQRTGQNAYNLMAALDLCLDATQSTQRPKAARPMQTEAVDLVACLRRAVTSIRHLPGWGNIELCLDFEPLSYRCELDETRMHQLLLNIADAISPKPSPKAPVLSAKLVQDLARDETWIEIKLGGPLSPNRENASSDRTVLAAAVSEQLMLDLQASPLPAKDNPKVLVGIKLPLVREIKAAQPPPDTQSLGKTPLVLVVDDNAINLKVASLLLKRADCSVEVAEDGAQAVRKASERPFDLILMDVRMPVMDGLEATRQIVSNSSFNASTPIVALTANAYESDRRACLDAGMVEHLAKPLNPRALALVLQRHLSAPSAVTERRCA